MAGCCGLNCGKFTGGRCLNPDHDRYDPPVEWVAHGDYVHVKGQPCYECGTLPKLPEPSYPSHLTCPYCPAQAMPTNVQQVGVKPLRQYQCPAKHTFYVQPEEEKN